ncbi:hypothetical protein [Moorena producens]|uniref:hypothetical protein n=1 Tax=Moorena producens TaxID=1155739 RepID=UPI0002DAC706|nr:hypothetical protein [Moorena producens]
MVCHYAIADYPWVVSPHTKPRGYQTQSIKSASYETDFSMPNSLPVKRYRRKRVDLT